MAHTDIHFNACVFPSGIFGSNYRKLGGFFLSLCPKNSVCCSYISPSASLSVYASQQMSTDARIDKMHQSNMTFIIIFDVAVIVIN